MVVKEGEGKLEKKKDLGKNRKRNWRGGKIEGRGGGRDEKNGENVGRKGEKEKKKKKRNIYEGKRLRD